MLFRICYSDNQSMLSTSDEYRLMFSTLQFYTVGLSETWFKDDRNILNNVITPGYNFEYGNYIIDMEISLEHLWLKIKWKSSKQCLLEALYQPNFEH